MNPWTEPLHIAIVGAGAVGCLVGGRLADAGLDVTLIDAWPEHVEAIQRHGLVFEEPSNTRTVNVRALHIGQVQSLYKHPADIAFICVKLYDTEWATALIAPYLSATGYVVTLQNGLIEETIAARVGWARTVGCIGSGLHVALAGPGHLQRARTSARSASPCFYVGEVHGRITPRARHLADMLQHVDTSVPTNNLWGLRWAKLVANCMTSALCAVADMDLKALFLNPESRRAMTQLASQAIVLGDTLGYDVENVFGLPAEAWVAAARGETADLLRVHEVFQKQYESLTHSAISGTAQDIQKGRHTEVAYMNGYIAARAQEAGVSVPHHAELANLIECIESGAAHPDRANLQRLA
ncbi:ketopantoate reductase family protein [Bordetella sp. BOR01]|uniref:ketopantoate reductase family protein n=1 Tax=Bordetella sp. BOR01 TaxID=2854779 RepID=UPI001C460E82|nr:2-dehydropantoate 2-reductase [Bordetella sp. BOR01]MBV7484829.1 2-dehydropantoate 2-reductase [Bordetella sp. BOR01]